jgi:hypothetical protein
MNLKQAIETIITRHGGVNAASRATGVTKSFFSDVRAGRKTRVGSEVLERLGLVETRSYKFRSNKS